LRGFAFRELLGNRSVDASELVDAFDEYVLELVIAVAGLRATLINTLAQWGHRAASRYCGSTHPRRPFGAGREAWLPPQNQVRLIVVHAPAQHCVRSTGRKSRHKTVAYTPVSRRRYNILAFKER
jgi:hypothetical protein